MGNKKRTRESFVEHLAKIRDCGKAWSSFEMQDLTGWTTLFIPNFCKSNYCDHCRKNNIVSLRKALFRSLNKKTWRLVTLTFEQFKVDKFELYLSCTKTFDKFMKRVRRVYKKISFARTIELHESGYPHFHLIVDQYIPIAFLQYHWKESGGGIVDIRAVPSCAKHQIKKCKLCYPKSRRMTYKDAARYLTEEFEKIAQDPHRLGVEWWLTGRRSFAVSRNMKLKFEKMPWIFGSSYCCENYVESKIHSYFDNLPVTKTDHMYIAGPGYKNSYERIDRLDTYSCDCGGFGRLATHLTSDEEFAKFCAKYNCLPPS